MIVGIANFFSISSSSIDDTDYYDEENEENCEYDSTGCDLKKHQFEVCHDDACNHNNFKTLTTITKLPKFSNFTRNKECCHGHGYLHVDLCKVSARFKYKSILV